MMPGAVPEPPPKTKPSKVKVIMVAAAVLVGVPLIPGLVVMRGCVGGRDAMQQHLDARRGRPLSPLPEHSAETRAALEQVARAESIEVDLPSSYSGSNGAATWCGTGTLRVQGRDVPFGIRAHETPGSCSVIEMSLVRLRCQSQGRKGATSYLR